MLTGEPQNISESGSNFGSAPQSRSGVISKNTSERGQGEFCGSSMSSAIKVLSSAAIPVAHVPDD
jgi:hypothetical protein